jgi:type II secretory pathway component PulF
VPRNSVATSLRSIAVLVTSGIALRRAIAAAIEQSSDRHMTETLRGILADLDGGTSLSEAMAHRPREFSLQVRTLAAAGEQGGSLEDALAQAAALLEREETLRKKIVATLAYPAFVLCAATALVAFLVIVTVPAFEAILAQLHAVLPLTTRIMLAFSRTVRHPEMWIVPAVATALAATLTVIVSRRSRVGEWLDAVALRAPLTGKLRRSANIACYCRTLGTLLSCGVVVTSAAETASGVVTSPAYRRETAVITKSLRAGTPLSKLFAGSSLIDAMTVQLASAGEESGSLDSMLVRAAEHHEAEVEHALGIMTAVLEPALICALGTVIATIVASIVIPLYSAIGNIR